MHLLNLIWTSAIHYYLVSLHASKNVYRRFSMQRHGLLASHLSVLIEDQSLYSYTDSL